MMSVSLSVELASERMQPETWHVHIRHRTGGVEPRENIAQLNNVFGDDAAAYRV
jgi:hypothetical protein